MAKEDAGVLLIKQLGPAKMMEIIRPLDEILEIKARTPEELWRKGKVLSKHNQDEEAIKCYNKAIKIDPENTDAWFYKAFSLFRLEKYQEAIECFDNVLKLNSEDYSIAQDYKEDCLEKLKGAS